MQSKISNVDVTVAILLAVLDGSRLLIDKLLKDGIPPLDGIGVGLFISLVCCVVAGVVELWRSHVYNQLEEKMSIFWLVPQCFLLGAEGGFAEEGISIFFDTRVLHELRVCYRLTSESVKLAGRLHNSLLLPAIHFSVGLDVDIAGLGTT